MGLTQNLIDAINSLVGAARPPTEPGEFVMLAEIDRFNIVSESEVLFRVATGEYTTKPTDTDPNEEYHARLVVPTLEQSILTDGDYAHTATVEYSDILVQNIDGYLDAEVDWSTYNLRGTRLVLLAGLDTWERSLFQVVPGGQFRIVSVQPDEDFIRLKVVPLHDRLDRPIQPNRYGGFGAAYDFGGTAWIDFGDVCDLAQRDCAIQIRFKTAGSGSVEMMLTKRNGIAGSAGNPGFGIGKNAADLLVMQLDDGTNYQAVSIGSAGEYTDELWHTLTVDLDRTNDLVNAWVDDTQEVTDLALTATGSLTNSESLVAGASNAHGNQWGGSLDEPRIWYTPLDDDAVSSNYNFSVDGAEDGLVAAWRVDEHSGTDIAQEVYGPMRVQAHLGGADNLDMGNIADPTSDSFILTAWARIKSAGTVQVVVGRKAAQAAANAGYVARINSTGDAVFAISDGSTEVTATITGDFDDGTPYGLGMVVNRDDDTLTGYVLDYLRGTLTASTPQDISSVGSLTNATTFRAYAYGGGANNLTGAVSSVFYSPGHATATGVKVLLSEQITDEHLDEPPTAPPIIDRITDGVTAHWWPIDEDTGSTANNRLSATNGTFSSTPDWINRNGTLTPGASGAWETTLEGWPEIKGKPKPLALGRPQDLSPVLVDPVLLIYQYSDPDWGPTQEIEAVRAGGVAVTPSATDLTNNTITLSAVEEEEITMDVKGLKDPDASNRWLRFPGEIASKVWRKGLGLPDNQVDTTTVTAYDDEHPYQASLYVGACELRLKDFHCKMLVPDGYAYRSSENKMALATRKDPSGESSELSLDSSMIEEIRPIELPPPSFQVRNGYRRTWYPIRSFDSAVDSETQQQSVDPWRYVQDQRLSVADRYEDAISRTYLTPHHKRRDAQLLVQKMLDLDDTPWIGWEVELTQNHWTAGMASVIDITEYDRYEADVVGFNFAVLGHRYTIDDDGHPKTSLLIARPT